MLHALRRFLLVAIIRPFIRGVVGLDVVGQRNLPKRGPAIIAANHNSHIDIMLLLCLFPARSLHLVRPVAAADHFLKGSVSRWLSLKIIGIIPVKRRGIRRGDDVLGGCKEALAREEILIIFPEGSRGEAEEMADFKAGIARLAEAFPDAPVYPVYLQGAGRVLPKGSRTLVPFNCSAVVGEPFKWCGVKADYMERLRKTMDTLKNDAPPLRWI